MAILPYLFFFVTGVLLHRHAGHYHQSAGFFTALFLLTVFSTPLISRRPRVRVLTPQVWDLILSGSVVWFLTRIFRRSHIVYATEGEWFRAFQGLITLSIVLALALFVLAAMGRVQKLFRWTSIALLAALFLGQAFTLLSSPQPAIDVFINNTAAADYLLKGLNPYNQPYEDIYQGAYDYVPGFLYFPGTLLWQTPFRLIFGDIRVGFIFAHLLTLLSILGLARQLKVHESRKWLIALLWFSFPVTFFVLEQAWTDSILVALTFLTFYTVEARRWLLAGALSGLAFSVKQYAFVIPLIALLRIWKLSDLGTGLRAFGVSALCFCAVVLPFLLADPASFFEFTVRNQWAPGVRLDAYNATVFLINELRMTPPRGFSAVMTVFGLGYGIWIAARLENQAGGRPARLSRSAFALFTMYGFAFFFGKWAFCNYWYFLASFLVLYFLAISSERRVLPPPEKT